MKKNIALFVTLGLTCLGSISCGSSSSSKAIRIGAIYSLRGDQAALDENSLRGAELAVAEINRRGGVLGTPIALEVRDANNLASDVTDAAEELYQQNGLPIVIGLSDTDLAKPVAETSQQLGAVFVTSGATGPILVSEAPDSTFLACFSDPAQAAAAAEYGFQHLHLRRVSLVYDSDSEYARVLSRSFREEFKLFGGSVQSEVPFGRERFDATAIVQRVMQEGPPAIFLAGQPEEVSMVIAALREAGFSGEILGGDSYDSALIFGLTDTQKKGVYFTTHAFLSGEPKSPEAAAFVERYAEQYGERPVSAFAALGFDAVGLVAIAIERAGSTESRAVRSALESIVNYRAVTGLVSYVPGRHIPSKDITIVSFAGSSPVQAAVIRR